MLTRPCAQAQVRDEELFPADLMCLYSELPENVCYIKTTNLDGGGLRPCLPAVLTCQAVPQQQPCRRNHSCCSCRRI